MDLLFKCLRLVDAIVGRCSEPFDRTNEESESVYVSMNT
jgi:hypothetical protein